MQYILNSQEMKQCDKNTSEHFKLPSIVLMERAALAFVWELRQRRIDLSKPLIVCGTGNNGGDGLAIARILALAGTAVTVVLVGDKDKATEVNKLQQEILNAYQIPIQSEIPDQAYTVVIDALFGVGLTREIEGDFAQVILRMNQCAGVKAAVDIASGISADSGKVMGAAFFADITVTFAFAKTGLLLFPGSGYSGEVVVKEIGIDARSFLGEAPKLQALERADLLSLLPKRRDYSNKGTYGRLLLIAGGVNMAGAAILAARAAYAAGCGLVKVLTPEENRTIIQTAAPEAVLAAYDREKPEEAGIADILIWADAIVIGPGLGTDQAARFLVGETLKEQQKPVLLDADALNLIAKEEELLQMLSPNKIITPHLGEMARLTGKKITDIQEDLPGSARDFAKKYQTVCVLKDARTVTALPNETVYLNRTGNSGMATAGSGDVLSGTIGALLAQRMSPLTAAPVGVFLHGMAGDAAAELIGKTGMTAADLIDGIKRIGKTLEDAQDSCGSSNVNILRMGD